MANMAALVVADALLPVTLGVDVDLLLAGAVLDAQLVVALGRGRAVVLNTLRVLWAGNS
jgi:hypothetical protein